MSDKARCKDHPILLGGELCYVNSLTVPRKITYTDGIFVLDEFGDPILFNDLIPIGRVHTDRFGDIMRYAAPGRDNR